jgi:hypothetical protein
MLPMRSSGPAAVCSRFFLLDMPCNDPVKPALMLV